MPKTLPKLLPSHFSLELGPMDISLMISELEKFTNDDLLSCLGMLYINPLLINKIKEIFWQIHYQKPNCSAKTFILGIIMCLQ